MSYQKKVFLLILDGLGVAPHSPGNAVSIAKPERLARLWETYPRTYLDASGEDVGLSENTNGNSEVGHLTIGSGKVHYQSLLKINQSIEKGHFFLNSTLKNTIKHCIEKNGRLHIMGCLSDGAVHSHINHFFAVLKFLKEQKFSQQVYIHAFTDGRDTPQKASRGYLERLEEKMNSTGIGKLATICGRAYAMDRNNITSRTKKAYDLIVSSKGESFKDWREAIEASYSKNITDEYIEPICLDQKAQIQKNDAILFMNFRPDRAIQLTKQLSLLPDILLTGMVEYEKGFPENILFPKEYLSLPIGRIVAETGYRQLRLAESEKFPHVTYFLNGGQPIQYEGEDRILIPSPNVETYDLQPEMSAYGILNALNQSISSNNKSYRLIVTNLANGDMVAHTGNLEASIKAIKVLDYVVDKMVKLAQKYNWTTIITSDHGNIERMIEPTTQQINTEHSQNPVPFLLIDREIATKLKQKQLRVGSLSDIAPTILKLMSIEKPTAMTGRSLI